MRLIKGRWTLFFTSLMLCVTGIALADENASQPRESPNVVQQLSDPGALEKVSTGEYSQARQFTEVANRDTPELQRIEPSRDLQIPDARQFVGKAISANRPVRIFELVSQDGSFKPVGEKTESGAPVAAPVTLIDNPEYDILLVLGLVLLAIIAFARRSDASYGLDRVAPR